MSDQLLKGRRFDAEIFVKGFMLIIWGFFLKLCIADKAGVVVNKVFDSFPSYQGMYVLIAGILYSIQLYADFCPALHWRRVFPICLELISLTTLCILTLLYL